MARKPTHRMRLPDRPDEPAVGTPEDTASPPDAAIQGSGGEPRPAPAGPNARRTGKPAGGIPSGGVASGRVAAAAAAAGAAVAGLPSGAEAVAAPTAPLPEAEPVTDVAAEVSSALSPAVANAEAEPVNAVEAPGAAEVGPRFDFEVAPVSAAGVAAASAVSAAMAATVAARASHRTDAGGYVGRAGSGTGAVTPGAASMPAPAATTALPPSAALDPNRRYMRQSTADELDLPDVPGIIRARHDPDEEPAAPPPLFSNEGMFRRAEAQRRSRFLGLVGGFVAALLGAGRAFGHTGGSSGPETETLAATAGGDVFIADSPDFLPVGNPRRSRKRKSAAMLAATALVVALFAVTAGAAFLPMEKGPVATATPVSSPTSPEIAALESSLAPSDSPADTATADPTAPPSDLVIGDDPLPPGATRKPVAKPTTTTPAAAPPATTAGPSPTATPPGGPGSTASATATYTPTAVPTPTPTPAPTSTPTPTPVPTPTPTPVLFALLYSVTPPAVSPGNGVFYVYSLPGATCNLYAYLSPFTTVWKKSNAFTTHSASASDAGWAYVAWGGTWGSTWPATNTTIRFTVRCSVPPNPATATSDPVSAVWPAHTSPSPSPT